MIRFFHNGYSTGELKILAQALLQIQALVPCGDKDCGECEYRHVCTDLAQFLRRLEHLEAEAIHNDVY